jgi:hypothetical protein
MVDAEMNRHWLELYRDAVLEPDRKKMSTLAAQAHRAIHRRTMELWNAGSPVTSERRQLGAASNFLGILRTMQPILKRRENPERAKL